MAVFQQMLFSFRIADHSEAGQANHTSAFYKGESQEKKASPATGGSEVVRCGLQPRSC
jgi:hypothetical protein